jgi:hypothetical protein
MHKNGLLLLAEWQHWNRLDKNSSSSIFSAALRRGALCTHHGSVDGLHPHPEVDGVVVESAVEEDRHGVRQDDDVVTSDLDVARINHLPVVLLNDGNVSEGTPYPPTT